MNYVARIKELMTCFDVCNLLGVQLNKQSRCKSYRQGAGNENSLLVSEKNWHDFGSGEGGDCISLYANFRGISNRQAIFDLAQMKDLNKAGKMGLLPEYSDRYVEIREEMNRQIGAISKNWTPEAKTFVQSKNITGQTVVDFKIGVLNDDIKVFTEENKHINRETKLNALYGRLIIPYLDKRGNVLYATGRSLDGTEPKYKKLPQSEFYKNALWGTNTLDGNTKHIHIVEGMFDALSLAQEKIPVISSTQTNFSKLQLAELTMLQTDRQITVCFDNDKNKAGLMGMLKLGHWFMTMHHKDIGMVVIEEEGKDISNLYAEQGNLDFLDKRTSYMEYMIMNELEESDKLISLIAQSFSEADQLKYKKMFIATGMDRKEVELKFKEKNKAPSEVVISEQMQEKYNLAYVEDDAWYLYKEDEGHWERIKEGWIQHLVGAEYNKHRTNSRVNNTSNLLKSDLNKGNLVMNQHQNLFNAKNGMINLDTKEIIPHAPTFYSSFQSDFSFHIPKDHKFAENFLKQISLGNEQDIQYYKDILGELLVPDNRFHMAHFHIGEGRNGKSALLEVMKYIVGDKNTTQIPMHGLNKDFLMIMLKDSMLNIATENDTHQKDCELTFKQIVAGEEIAACRKNKDYINFKTRAKFHFAMNNLPKIYDKSDGVVDRMRLCEYRAKFVEDPKEEHHLKKILNYHYVLQEHIEEFIDIAIDSRNRILKEEQISYPSSHNEIMTKIREISNPILTFLKHKNFREGEFYEVTELYSDYREFCNEEHHRPTSKSSFQVNLEKALPLKYMTQTQSQFKLLKKEAS